MSERDQFDLIWDGNFLGDRNEGGLRIQCYSLGSFYVEVYYDPEANEIRRLRSFAKITQLAPYLGPISPAGAINNSQ